MASSNDRGPRGDKRDDKRDGKRGAPRGGAGKPRADGGAVVRVSRILDAPAAAVFRALNDPARRGWSPEPLYRVVSALAPRFVRLALPDGSQVSIGITRQGNVRCSVAVEQSGLPASVPVNVARDRWMGALAALAEQLDAEWD